MGYHNGMGDLRLHVELNGKRKKSLHPNILLNYMYVIERTRNANSLM
jgi:uncharacterized protein (DUF1697 family)